MVAKKSLLDRGHMIALPPLEDRLSIQLALSEVINALACDFIEVKRANAMLLGLQIASRNTKGLDPFPQPHEVVRDAAPAPGMLESVAVDLAPPGLTCEIEESPNIIDAGRLIDANNVSDAASRSDAAGPDPLATCNLQPATPEPASDPDPFALQLAQLYNRQNPHPVNLPFLEPHTLQPANGNPHP
jgi:hypothetical protein